MATEIEDDGTNWPDPAWSGTAPPAVRTEPSDIADRTWRQGFVHLTVDGDGMVSLWDDPMPNGVSYLKLPLTHEQVGLIQATMAKNGSTP